MGGKVWSEEEERVFWTEIVPTSSKRLLRDRPHGKDAKGWEDLCQIMQTTIGAGARRQYTALMLYEHFFQNTVLKRYSPNAIRYARAYQAKHMTGRPRATQGRRLNLSAPMGTEERPGAEDPAATTGGNEYSSSSTSDALQMAIDAFELLSRADRRHKRSVSQAAADSFVAGGSGAGLSSDASASSGLSSGFGGASSQPHLSASNSAASLAPGVGGHYHPGQLPVYPQYVVPSQLGLSHGATDLSVAGFTSAGGYNGYSSGSSSGTPGSGMAMQQHQHQHHQHQHQQNLGGSYFGYMPPVPQVSQMQPMHTPGNGAHKSSSPQEAGAVAGQTTGPAGYPHPSTSRAAEGDF